MPPVVIDIRSAEDSRDVVHRAVQALADGKLVAFPTETVYGLAASALNPAAVERLLTSKRRAQGHALTLAIKSADEALDYVPDMSPLAQRLARRCWPGPVTLVLPGNHPDSLLNQLPAAVRPAVTPAGMVGLRVPFHPTILDTMRMIAGPLVLSSANRSGEADAVTAEDVVQNLGDDVQLVLADGRSRYGQPSSVVKVVDDTYEVLRAGVVPEQTIKRLSSFMVLFVCTGNTCRSPMAEVIFRKMLADALNCDPNDLEDRGLVVLSAGISAMPGSRAAAEAIQVVSEMGLDLTAHESQPLTPQLIRMADQIWTMTRSHRQAIISQFPEAASRTGLLCEDHRDVADPIGGPPEEYLRCARQLKAELENRLKNWKIPGLQ